MLQVTPRLAIPDEDLSVKFTRSGGPGGQNVNKVATRVELRLALDTTEALGIGVKRRLRAAFPSHVTDAGDFLVTSSRYRSQSRNRADAERRLAEMIRAALKPPKARKKTAVPRAQKLQRLDTKRRRGELKRGRRTPPPE